LQAIGPAGKQEKDQISQRKRRGRKHPAEIAGGKEGEEQIAVENQDKRLREKPHSGEPDADAQKRAERRQARALRKAESRAGRVAMVPVERTAEKQTEDPSDPEGGQEADLYAVADEDDLLDQEDNTQRAAISRPLPEQLEVRLCTRTAEDGDILYESLKTVFQANGVKIQRGSGDEADLVVYFGPATSQHIRSGRIATVFVASEQGQASDVSVSAAAAAESGIFLPLSFLVERHSKARLLDGEGGLTAEGAAVLAAALREQVFFARSQTLFCDPTSLQPPEDLAAALSLSERPPELLKALTWVDDVPPSSIRVPLNPKSVEHFLDGNVCLSVRDGAEPLPFYFPFDWQNAVSSRGAENALYGLDFATNVLVYWQLKATGVSSPNLANIGTAVRERGITAASLLSAAGAVILDCLSAGNALPETAWHVTLLQRRARACEMFLLCCKIAARRRIRFDESACSKVFSGLLGILERLRAVTFTDIGSCRSVGHAVVLIGLALPLKKITYGQVLLAETLGALHSVHLDRGMSADGVWREGFAQHCSVFGLLRTLTANLKGVDGAGRSIFAESSVKLARFIDGFLSADGSVPPIGEMPPMNHRKLARPARMLLKSATASASNRALARRGESGLWLEEAGYFISRTDISTKPSTYLVVQARSAPAGGPSLSFIVESEPLLIGGGTQSRRAPLEARRASREEPSVHNTIRLNDLSYAQADNHGPEAIRLEAAWGGENWSAARLINGAFAQMQMARTVIHLKALTGLLIIDELMSRVATAKFEQFWQLAPRMLSDDGAGAQLHIGCPGGGVLTATFDRMAPAQFIPAAKRGLAWTSTSKRGAVPNPQLLRTTVAANALLGALFRWQPRGIDSQLQVDPANGGWVAAIASGKTQLRFGFQNGQLTLAQ
jgi:hypothetical protein